MQEEFEKYDNLLTTLNDNFGKMLEKLYTRENVSVVTEVKEIYFSQNNSIYSIILLLLFSFL